MRLKQGDGEAATTAVPGRADTVEEIGDLLRAGGVEPVRWYGVWLFVDWLESGGTVIEAGDGPELAAIAAVELEAARRDPLPRAQPGLPPGRPQGAADQLGS